MKHIHRCNSHQAISQNKIQYHVYSQIIYASISNNDSFKILKIDCMKAARLITFHNIHNKWLLGHTILHPKT